MSVQLPKAVENPSILIIKRSWWLICNLSASDPHNQQRSSHRLLHERHTAGLMERLFFMFA